jgi:hypothetical protein
LGVVGGDEMTRANKVYIGDSVYAQRGSYEGEIVLTTENGLPDDPSNRIVLGPNEICALVHYLQQDTE